MALVNATSFAGILLLIYLSSFVFLAVLRVATGISIQRVGYFSLRHISYTPREGLTIYLRGLGLSIHRPTFVKPTWISLVFQELKVTIDPSLYGNATSRWGSSSTNQVGEKDQDHHQSSNTTRRTNRSQLWKKLTNLKDRIKRVHGNINWLRAFDISATDASVELVGVGYAQVSSFTIAVHTRRKLLDRGRLFRHKKDPLGDQKPAEWIFTIRNVFLAVGGHEPVEILDAMAMNVHGLLYKDREGLRDTSIALKVGRLYIPVDDILQFTNRSKNPNKVARHAPPISPVEELSFEDVVEELDSPGSREASIVQAVADSKEFLSSILHSVQEIQFSMSFIRISKEIESLRKADVSVTANLVTHEIGIDLHRLDQNSPAHRMYFSRKDIAHQALLAAVSISVTLDENESNSNKILYVPMATTTIRTTLPAKTMTLTQERDVAERNTNVVFANFVVTSPSVDLMPQLLIQLLALVKQRTKSSPKNQHSRHRLISRLLPKANIKFSIHEPVVRFVLPVADPENASPDDYDMLISAVSSVSLDVESSHATGGELLYSLASNFRVMSHQLYYQTSAGAKHNLLVTEALELKTQVSASTEVLVVMNGVLRTFSVLMVRKEVSQGIYNVVRHFKSNVYSEKLDEKPKNGSESFLRLLPPWLLELHLEGTNCSFEAAGTDPNISNQTRGLALELDNWTVDYNSQRSEAARSPSARRKTSMSVRQDEAFKNVKHLSPPTSPSRNKIHGNATDGRRLAFHIKGFQSFIIEAVDKWENHPFMSLPRLEIAFSTSRDMQGPIFHINSVMRAFYLEFSLYRYYSIGVAMSVLQDAFLGPPSLEINSTERVSTTTGGTAPTLKQHNAAISSELLSVDFRASYVQVKATMPADPPILLQIYDVTAGRHRWSPPFLRSHLIRLHAEAPHLKNVWARLVTMNNIRLDMRQSKKKTVKGFVDEKSVDIWTDFIRLAIPHGLQMYKVFDNFVNTFKTIAQLHHRFKTRTNEYILKKEPESPKKIPRVTLRCKALMFQLDDDPFEWKLSTIYHVGRTEQKQRLARADAFKLKVKKLNEDRYPSNSSKYRTQSSRGRSPEDKNSHETKRAKSQDSFVRRRSTSRGRSGKHNSKFRYDREGVCALSNNAKLKGHEAWQKLEEHNARSWKKRIDWMMLLQNNTVKNIRRMFSGADEPPHDSDEHETVLGIPNRPGLMTLVISDLHLVVDKPSFPESELPKFMHDIGKGMPHDMQYGLLIPLNLALDMGEARVLLRDYPLNLLHIPAIRPGQPPRLPSWSLRSDFVIAEEYRDDQSSRHVMVDVVPKGQRDPEGAEIPGFAIDVRRTVSPVKTFSKPVIEINTSLPTTISWGTSYQPVIQDMMMIIEGFTKPEIDPSDRVGFWDKIRLSFHSRLTVNWKGDGDVQLRLKGSRDPYIVTGYGAGFVMCWRNDVNLSIHTGEDPRKFIVVKSGEYVLAIPDYSHEARAAPENRATQEGDSMSTNSNSKNAAVFKKVIMKISGNVQWTAGLVFERDTEDGRRSSKFEPHYNVILRNPKQMHGVDLKNYDAFRGFRSNYIHLSVAVAGPQDRDWLAADSKPSTSYNSVHLSPRFFSHFYDWWSLFSGIMSLPIRQGSLWKGPEKTSKKFGRHLATIKYGLLLSPLFLAHVYKHKDAEDYQEDVVSATGLKIRIDNFMLDIHQRREYFDSLRKGKSEQMRTSAMKINKAELDFIRADLRAVAASIAGTTAEDLRRATDEMLSSYQESSPNVDMSQFTIPDHDLSWIDMDDFVELDWVLPAESNPETKILPLAFTPRFTYFRQTDHDDGIQGDNTRTSPFGEEDTHTCTMSYHNDPRRVQMILVDKRLQEIDQKMQAHKRLIGEQDLQVVREGSRDESLKQHHSVLLEQQKELERKHRFLQHGLKRLGAHVNPGEASEIDNESGHNDSNAASNADFSTNSSTGHIDMDGLFSASNDEFASDFNNRFIVHNAQLKWNNSLRNIILRYSHQVSQRRGFVYYMSRRAVKFILDIVNEQGKAKESHKRPSVSIGSTPGVMSFSEEKDEEGVVEDRIQQLLNDAKRFVNANDETDRGKDGEQRPSTADFGDTIAEEFQAMNSYHIRLIAPQIQLQSEKNTKSVVLVSAKGMQLKVVAIMDKARMSDSVSGLVQRRFALDMDGAQFYVTNQKTLAKYLYLYSSNRYGNAPGSDWPPWVSLEAMFDFHVNPFGFQRVIERTSASLRFEKYNPLRLKYNEEVAMAENNPSKNMARKESRIDQLWVDFPRIRARCDSVQYYAMYVIVLDLLLYSEPLEKTRTERLEKIMLASDFSDLRGTPEMAERLQERIRQLEDIKLHFQINAKLLDKHGWEDRINIEKDLASCEDELFFIMKAINTSQQKLDDRKSAQSSGLLRWYLSASEIVWHLMREKDEPLLEFQLGNAAYERIDNSDGSNHNALEISHIRGWNLLPNALYPEIIGPYDESGQKRPFHPNENRMLQVHWYMLEAIAGIPVLEQFQVTLFPLKVQLERELGKKLFEYIFPGIGSNAFDDGGFSPMAVKNMEPIDDEEDLDIEDSPVAFSPHHDTGEQNYDVTGHASPGAFGRRLKPTYNLNYAERPGTASSTHSNKKGLGISSEHHPRFFKHKDRPKQQRNATDQPLVRRASATSMKSIRKPNEGSSTSLSGLGKSEEKKRNALHRGSSKDRSSGGKKNKNEKPSDDLSQMISRASNYMTLAHVKLNTSVICLSYKGKSDRNLEDLHDFVFRLPTLEYRNKTWSNLDLALRLKKDVIRAVISHTGSIIGNKLSHHRPSKKQQDRLRELASSSLVIPNSDTPVNASETSETTSLYSFSQNGDDYDPSRLSFQGNNSPNGNGPGQGMPGPLMRSGSWASSINMAATSQPPPRSVPANEVESLATNRPSTAVFHGRSLLKDTFGRHFSGHDSTKGKVHFGSLGLNRSDSAKDSSSTHNSNHDGYESDPEGQKKKSVLLLGKKVLGRLG